MSWKRAAFLLTAGLGLGITPALSQEVLLNGVSLGGPIVAGQVAIPDNGLLKIENGASITNNGVTVIDAVDGSTINIDNLGTINSTAGDGVNVLGSTLVQSNSGTVTASSSGIAAHYITNLVNSGTILGTNFNGVYLQPGVGVITSMTNTGTVASTFGWGINAPTITNLVNAGVVSGSSRGISADLITNLVNSGTITGTNGEAINTASLVSLTNTGRITGQNGNAVSATTITSFTNAGTVIGSSGTAIREFGAADTVLTLLPGSNIQGLVDLGGGVNTVVVGNGLSTATTFAAAPDIINSSGQPFALAGTTLHVVDPTGFSMTGSQLADTTGAISDVLAGQFGGGSSGSVQVAMGDGTGFLVTPVSDNGLTARAWAEVFGGWKDRAGDGADVGSTNIFGGIVGGIEMARADAGRIGVFVGGSAGEVEVDNNAQDIDTETVFGGLYASHDNGVIRLDAAVTVGLADYDSDRFVANNTAGGGIQVARAEYDGVFVSPELTVSTSMTMGPATLRPSLRVRYAGLWLDSYSESGSSSNLSVDDREVHILEARAQVSLPMTVASGENGTLTTEIRTGIDVRTKIGSDRVDAILVGQQLSFDSGGDDEVLTAFISAAFAMAFADALTVSGALEGGYGTDETAHAIARLRATVDF